MYLFSPAFRPRLRAALTVDRFPILSRERKEQVRQGTEAEEAEEGSAINDQSSSSVSSHRMTLSPPQRTPSLASAISVDPQLQKYMERVLEQRKAAATGAATPTAVETHVPQQNTVDDFFNSGARVDNKSGQKTNNNDNTSNNSEHKFSAADTSGHSASSLSPRNSSSHPHARTPTPPSHTSSAHSVSYSQHFDGDSVQSDVFTRSDGGGEDSTEQW